MIIKIQNRFNPKKTYLQAKIDWRTHIDIQSPLPAVMRYYSKNVYNDFDFSFVDDKGIHIIKGDTGTQLRNLITLLAYEQTFYNRHISFKYTNISDLFVHLYFKYRCLFIR